MDYKEKDEKLIGDLASDERWQAMKKAINSRIEGLKNMIDPLSNRFIIEKDTPEMVGFKYLIVSAIIDYLIEVRDLPDRVNEARELTNE